MSYGALQNQVQDRIKADELRIQNELTARRDIMKIKFKVKIENLMFSIAIQSGEFFKLAQTVVFTSNIIEKKFKKLS